MRKCLTKKVMPRYILDEEVFIKVPFRKCPKNYRMKNIIFHNELYFDEKAFYTRLSPKFTRIIPLTRAKASTGLIFMIVSQSCDYYIVNYNTRLGLYTSRLNIYN